VCVCVCVCEYFGGGGGDITIKLVRATSMRKNAESGMGSNPRNDDLCLSRSLAEYAYENQCVASYIHYFSHAQRHAFTQIHTYAHAYAHAHAHALVLAPTPMHDLCTTYPPHTHLDEPAQDRGMHIVL